MEPFWFGSQDKFLRQTNMAWRSYEGRNYDNEKKAWRVVSSTPDM